MWWERLWPRLRLASKEKCHQKVEEAAKFGGKFPVKSVDVGFHTSISGGVLPQKIRCQCGGSEKELIIDASNLSGKDPQSLRSVPKS